MITDKEIADRFEHHPPSTPDVAVMHGTMRHSFKELALIVNNSLEEGREKSLCLTALEEGMHWANTSIAKNQTPYPTI